MSLLITAVALVGLLAALDLLLTVGVIKRLRDHANLISAKVNEEAPAGLDIGAEVGDFSVTSADDEELTLADIEGDTLVAFFSPNCTPCKEKLPLFTEYARHFPGGPRRVLAVIAGGAEGGGRFAEALRPVARVVREDYNGEVGAAFQAKAYPTLLLVGREADGRVVVRANQVDLAAGLPLAA
ncbi:TlpA disulfide reductase family protein [Streptomyces sp. NPDC048270]|uniref:TlpA disulfide reductase family protein n=1 Tax=Streptomyces sp. NPDC048270 TaxID=3154615 RepID=UPI0033FA6B0E